jgi:hypothetical protein
MAEAVARALPNPPQIMEVANQLLTAMPQCFLELAGRNIARRSASQLEELRTEAFRLDDRLDAFQKCAEKALGSAALWNAQIADRLYEITDPLWGKTLAQEIERLRTRLTQIRDAIPQNGGTATASKRGRKAETHINEFLSVLKDIWKQLTNLHPAPPRHRGISGEFVGDFLDFAWAAVELARKFPNHSELGLPHSRKALGKRLASKLRAKSHKARGK